MAKKETKEKAVKKTKKPIKETAATTSLPMEDESANSVAATKKRTAKKAVVKEPALKLTASKKAEAKKTKQESDSKPMKKAAKTSKKAEIVKEKKAVADKAEAKPKTVKAPKEEAKTKKVSAKTVKKPTSKKATKKTLTKAEKLAHYEALPLAECITLMQSMKVSYQYEDYYRLLMEEADMGKLEQAIIEGNRLKEAKLRYEDNGCDEDLVAITLQKVAATMDVKAADYKDLKKAITKALKFQIGEDGERSAAAYLDEFQLAEKLLMIAQRKHIGDTKTETDLMKTDVAKFFEHFFAFAYAILPDWQYSDVKFYEDFVYAVLSQFSDLYEQEQMRIQMDVADLYIKHGDSIHGDEMYGYILRDNQIKDYIYYRYASVYKDIDYNKAKAIAYSALQYVDERFTYHANIMELIHNE